MSDNRPWAAPFRASLAETLLALAIVRFDAGRGWSTEERPLSERERALFMILEQMIEDRLRWQDQSWPAPKRRYPDGAI